MNQCLFPLRKPSWKEQPSETGVGLRLQCRRPQCSPILACKDGGAPWTAACRAPTHVLFPPLAAILLFTNPFSTTKLSTQTHARSTTLAPVVCIPWSLPSPRLAHIHSTFGALYTGQIHTTYLGRSLWQRRSQDPHEWLRCGLRRRVWGGRVGWDGITPGSRAAAPCKPHPPEWPGTRQGRTATQGRKGSTRDDHPVCVPVAPTGECLSCRHTCRRFRHRIDAMSCTDRRASTAGRRSGPASARRARRS